MTFFSSNANRLCIILLGFFIFASICITSSSLHALEITPFNTKNQSPIIQVYGLPAAGNAILLSPGQKEFHVMLDYTSNYVDDAKAGEHIVLDGETARFTLNGRYGLIGGIECGIEIPYIIHGGGFLDSFIINYHDLFGFPQGGRDQAPRNRLLYLYARDGVEKMRIDSSSSGIGDISLFAGFQIYQDGKEYPNTVALRTSLKLPTGDSGQLHGSGSTDLAIWLTAGSDHKLASGHWTIFGNAGVLVMTDGQVIEEQQRNLVGFGSVGAGWSPLSWIAFKVQLDAHTPFYKDSQLRELNTDAVQLLIGGTLSLSRQTTLDIGVSEDLIVNTSPDVVFHFDLRTRF
ncbi:MAG TPA: DUF3187 family protein [Syntrophales bacterium]|nr:DUF3187 family protein [Syntrophales bacterium]